MKFISLSLVCYKTKNNDILNVIRSLSLCKLPWKLVVIDNSPDDKIAHLVKGYKNIEYIHNPKNPGFGAAHNIAITKAIKQGFQYHFVVNPDIFFESDIISPMVNYIEAHPSVGMLMPQVLNLDGTVQTLPKLLPTPLNIIWRKIKKPAVAYQKFINKYELRDIPNNLIYNAPVISGCFTLLNLAAIREVGMYDDDYFMYFEDWDLSRRMHEKYQTLYFPVVSVFHGYESGANKSFKLFKIFIKSAFTYFNKWGWFFDVKRKIINLEALSQLSK